MFTNLAASGGNFYNVLDIEFREATNVTIASGYTSLDIINTYTSDFIRIANSELVFYKIENGKYYLEF